MVPILLVIIAIGAIAFFVKTNYMNGSNKSDVSVEEEKKPGDENRFYAPEAKILLIDDEEESCQTVDNILSKLNIPHEFAYGGIEGIEKVKQNEYHMILISHSMARMDGLQTLRNLKKTAGNLSIGAATYALTRARVCDVEEAYKNEGFDGCLSKPVGEYELTWALMEQLPSELVTFSGNVKEQMKKAMEAEQLLRECDITLAYGMEHCENDVDKYKMAASVFCDDYDELHSTVAGYLYDKKFDLYAQKLEEFIVYADDVGALILVELAKEHIAMAKSQDFTALDAAWRDFTLAWEKAIGGLREWLGIDDTFTNVTEVLVATTDGVDVTKEVLNKKIGDIIACVDVKDVDRALELFDEVRAFNLDADTRVYVEIASVSLRANEFDKAHNTLAKLLS